MIRTCPRCRLVNPPEAVRCDCGYDFVAQQVSNTLLSESERSQAVGSTNAVRLSCVLGLTGGALGCALGVMVQVVWYRVSGAGAADIHGYGLLLYYLPRAFGLGAFVGFVGGLLMAVVVSVRRSRRLR
jgi:hypothetical protein